MQFDNDPVRTQSSNSINSTFIQNLAIFRLVTLFSAAMVMSVGTIGCDPAKSDVPKEVPTTEPADVAITDEKEASDNSAATETSDSPAEAKTSNEPAAEEITDASKVETTAEEKDEAKPVTADLETGSTATPIAAGTPIRVLAWNIESNGANPDVIAKQLGEMDRYDIYGFSEVRAAGFPAIKAALGKNYFYKFTKSGFDDRLAFAINLQRFDVVDHYEFNTFKGHMINPGNYRAPFVVELKDKTNGETFLVVLNHLARGKAEIRQEQALAIRMWAKAEGKPIIAIGDYNFDYVFDTDKGNRAMDVFLEDGTFKWIRPVPMVDSNYYDEDKDGVDDFIDSLLDFAFAAGEAKNWKMDCQVVVRDGDFPDDEQTSDHRPVQLIIQR